MNCKAPIQNFKSIFQYTVKYSFTGSFDADQMEPRSRKRPSITEVHHGPTLVSRHAEIIEFIYVEELTCLVQFLLTFDGGGGGGEGGFNAKLNRWGSLQRSPRPTVPGRSRVRATVGEQKLLRAYGTPN